MTTVNSRSTPQNLCKLSMQISVPFSDYYRKKDYAIAANG